MLLVVLNSWILWNISRLAGQDSHWERGRLARYKREARVQLQVLRPPKDQVPYGTRSGRDARAPSKELEWSCPISATPVHAHASFAPTFQDYSHLPDTKRYAHRTRSRPSPLQRVS